MADRSVLSLRPPGPARLEALLSDQQGQEPTYVEVGATGGPLPPGYRHGRHEAVLGRGGEVFDRAVEDLRHWRPQRGSGVGVTPAHAPVEAGTTVVLTPRLAGVHLTLACRVVYVVTEPGRFGFAYGTLPHHVLDGEEAFLVERDEAGVVRFRVISFTRQRGVARLAAPLAHRLDQWFVRRYLRAMRRVP